MARLTPVESLESRAERTVSLIERGTSAKVAAKAGGFDERLASVVAEARPADARRVLCELATHSQEPRRLERSLRTALLWPTATLALSLASGVVQATIALPALRRLPLGGPRAPIGPILLGVGLLGVALLGLGALAQRRRLPGLLSAWRSLDAWGFLAAVVTLRRAGLELPRALRAAAQWCAPTLRPGPVAFARALEAGSASPAQLRELLGEVQAGALSASAPVGTTDLTLEILSGLAASAARREAPRDAARLQATALLLSGAALTAMGVAFYSTYVRAVTG